MLADVISTFTFSLSDLEDMEWEEFVRWHCQHQRIVEERTQLAQIAGQMASMTVLQAAFGTGQNQDG